MLMEGAFECGESLLCASEISRLQLLAEGGEILLALADLEGVAVRERAALRQVLNGLEFLLRDRKIAFLQRLPELLQIRASLVKVGLKFLIKGRSWVTVVDIPSSRIRFAL